jgi:large subunit ribosomal protein L29
MAEQQNSLVAKELRGRTTSELQMLLREKEKELMQQRFKRALGQLKQTHRLRVIKCDIARLNLVIGEKVSEKIQ